MGAKKKKVAEGSNVFVTISEDENGGLYAYKTDTGILIKTTTKDNGSVVSESTMIDPNGVIVNHGTVAVPVWKLSR